MKPYHPLLFSLLIACGSADTPLVEVNQNDYYQTIKNWQSARHRSLTSSSSWLSLAGLFWLKEGKNTFGSAATNTITFPEKAPEFIGSFTLKNGAVTMKIGKDIPVKVGIDEPKEILLKSDQEAETTEVNLGTLNWYLIQREDRFAIRLKDAENPAIQSFGTLDYFPIQEKWKVPAKLKKTDATQTVTLRNVVDMDVAMQLEGYLTFEINGRQYELEAMDGGPDLYFVIFSDGTTGIDTYGAGRYLYVPRVDETGDTFIDFNKTYNPPCVFTDFATCPLPSQKNSLELSIRAGELVYKKE